MKNTVPFILSLLFLLPSDLQAQVKKYVFGDSIFVWASSLNMRERPSPDAKVIGKVPYGSAVVVVDDSIGKVAYKFKAVAEDTLENGERSKPFYLHGFWVKVNFDGTVGYVFDGYLSKVKTMTFKKDWFEALEVWAKDVLKLRPRKYEKGDDAWTEYLGKSDNIRVRIGHSEKFGFREIKLKMSTLEEGCMLGIRLFEGSYLISTSTGRVVFKSKDENGDCEVWITKEGEWIEVSLICSC